MGNFIDLTGQKFGKLTVLKRDMKPKEKATNVHWLCQCSCGSEPKIISSSNLKGTTKSCGCVRLEYLKEMKENKKSKNYNWKGGRVIDKQRGLKDYEIVHHRNGIRGDNSIGNLELCTKKKHPPSQRVEDMVEFCKKYLFEYDKDSLSEKRINEIEKGNENAKEKKQTRNNKSQMSSL